MKHISTNPSIYEDDIGFRVNSRTQSALNYNEDALDRELGLLESEGEEIEEVEVVAVGKIILNRFVYYFVIYFS